MTCAPGTARAKPSCSGLVPGTGPPRTAPPALRARACVPLPPPPPPSPAPRRLCPRRAPRPQRACSLGAHVRRSGGDARPGTSSPCGARARRPHVAASISTVHLHSRFGGVSDARHCPAVEGDPRRSCRFSPSRSAGRVPPGIPLPVRAAQGRARVAGESPRPRAAGRGRGVGARASPASPARLPLRLGTRVRAQARHSRVRCPCVSPVQAEGEDSLKKMQLMELAILNGTYRDANIKSRKSGRPAPAVPARRPPSARPRDPRAAGVTGRSDCRSMRGWQPRFDCSCKLRTHS